LQSGISLAAAGCEALACFLWNSELRFKAVEYIASPGMNTATLMATFSLVVVAAFTAALMVISIRVSAPRQSSGNMAN
jgi:hypothetical protein